MIDYVAVSGTKDGRVIEYVDHLHEHFLEPCRIENAAYMPPRQPGFSIEMKPETLERFALHPSSGSHGRSTSRSRQNSLRHSGHWRAVIRQWRFCSRKIATNQHLPRFVSCAGSLDRGPFSCARICPGQIANGDSEVDAEQCVALAEKFGSTEPSHPPWSKPV